MSGPGYLQRTPTVFPAPNFNASTDAEVLYYAIKGIGVDEETIINILTKRSNAQRLSIATEFMKKYDKDLVKELQRELIGDFEDVILVLMEQSLTYYATEIYKAVKGVGTDENALIDILCPMTNKEIRAVSSAYQKVYNRSMRLDIEDDTSGDFQKVLMFLCDAERDESGVVNEALATSDAEKLIIAGVNQKSTDENVFINILCKRNFNQLRKTFDEYKRLAHHDIEDAIESEFSGDIRKILLAIVSITRNLPGYFAECLNNSMVGLGTDDGQLIRIIVGRSEIDMGEIKTAYDAKYDNTLENHISDDTSGNYKKTLLNLIGIK